MNNALFATIKSVLATKNVPTIGEHSTMDCTWPEYNKRQLVSIDTDHEFINKFAILDETRFCLFCKPSEYINYRSKISDMKRACESYRKTEVLITFFGGESYNTDFYVYEFDIDTQEQTLESSIGNVLNYFN